LILFSLIIGQGHPFVYILKILLFVIFIFIAGYLIIKYSIKKSNSRQTIMLVLPIPLIICFIFAALAEDMGLAAIIGAFIAGLIIHKTPQGSVINSYIKTIAYTLFIPLFFVWVGASFNFFGLLSTQNILPSILFLITFIAIGLLGNPIGAAIGAKLAGNTSKDSLSIGIGMIPVMGMSLIIVSTEVDRGIYGDPTGVFAQQVKAATLFLIIISCLITPHLLKKSMNKPFIGKQNKKERLNKFKLLIIEGFSNKKISANYAYHVKYPNDYKNSRIFYFFDKKLELPRKTKHLLVNILIGSILIQLFFVLKTIKYTDINIIITALIGGIIGSCLGYFILKKYYATKIKILTR